LKYYISAEFERDRVQGVEVPSIERPAQALNGMSR
jgi:hypothetical protein